MGCTASTEPQSLYKGAPYLTVHAGVFKSLKIYENLIDIKILVLRYY